MSLEQSPGTSAPPAPSRIPVVLVVAALLGSAHQGVAQQPSPSPEKPTTTSVGTNWTVQLDLATRYDDNITELSDPDRRRLEDPACQATPSCRSRFKIESADDTVLVPEGRVEWARTSSGGLETSLRGEARLNRYTRNPIKDYEVYGFRFAQELVGGDHPTTLVARVDHIPDYYLRELSVAEASRIAQTTVRDSARFAATDLDMTIRQVLVRRRLELEARAVRERRDYQAPFDERDGDLTGWGADLELSPSGSRSLALRAGYRSQSYDARGDNLATAALEPDISNRRRILLAGVAVRWGARRLGGSLALDASREEREYTTGEARDIYHNNRDDTRTRFALSLRQKVSRHVFLEGRAAREENVSNLGPLAVAVGDDVTDFTQNVYSLAAGWRP